MIARLRLDGHSVISVKDSLAGSPDTVVLDAAEQRGMILITHDRDFGTLAILRELPVRGVVLIELERLPLGHQIERLAACIQSHGALFDGQMIVVEPGRIRTRLLPNPAAR